MPKTPMHRYHPIRLDLIEQLERLRRDKNAAELQAKLLTLMAASPFTPYEMKRDRSFKKTQDSEEYIEADVAEEWRKMALMELKASTNSFVERGKNIFDMTLISPMFRHVDVDEVVLSDTPLPFGSFFMYFGLGAELTFKDGHWIEGAYVRETCDPDRRLVFTFVCNHPDWERTADVRLGETFKKVTTAVTITVDPDSSVAASIRAQVPSGDPDLVSSQLVLASAVRMSVNSLLYLNLSQADVEFDYPAEAPPELVSAARSPNPAKADRATRSLDDQGYIKVNFCGRRLARAIPLPATSTGGSHRQTHWRRGHWKRVAVGEGRTGREWRLIHPTIVNGIPGQGVRGRVHVVRPSGVAN
jgi:hypothetical protein